MAGKSGAKRGGRSGPKLRAKRQPVKLRADKVARALAGTAEPIVAPAAEQLALLPLPPVASPTGLDQAPDGPTNGGPRGPGRPPGSRNKRTEDQVAFILARYRNPLIVLAETYSRPVEQLAEKLGCTKLEAFELQQAAAKELAPYVASKMPQALEIDDKRGVPLVLVVAPDMAPKGAPTLADMPAIARVIEHQRKQGDSAPDEEPVGREEVGR